MLILIKFQLNYYILAIIFHLIILVMQYNLKFLNKIKDLFYYTKVYEDCFKENCLEQFKI